MKLKIFIKNKARFNKMPLSLLRNQNGVTAVLVAIVLAMLLGFTALAVDVGYMYSTRNELQNVADAAALAGAGELGRIYLSMPYNLQQGFEVTEGQKTNIHNAAIDVAILNQGAGKLIVIDPNDIIISIWKPALGPDQPLAEILTQPDAVRVTARREAGINDAVTTFFGKILSLFGGNADTFQVSAVATAALSGPSTAETGELIMPVGISENWFKINTNYCLDKISFSPADSCAGWHNFFDDANTNAISAELIGFIEAYESTNTNSDGTNDNGHDWLEKHFDINPTPTPEVTPATDPDADPDDPTIFNFIGGKIGALFLGGYYAEWTDKNTAINPDKDLKHPAPFVTLFDFFRFRDDDADEYGNTKACGDTYPANEIWTATVPIYDDVDDCSDNPNDPIVILGYASIKVIRPNPPPSTDIQVCVDCDFSVIDGRGGGGTFGGIKGSIPNLVQ